MCKDYFSHVCNAMKKISVSMIEFEVIKQCLSKIHLLVETVLGRDNLQFKWRMQIMPRKLFD